MRGSAIPFLLGDSSSPMHSVRMTQPHASPAMIDQDAPLVTSVMHVDNYLERTVLPSFHRWLPFLYAAATNGQYTQKAGLASWSAIYAREESTCISYVIGCAARRSLPQKQCD